MAKFNLYISIFLGLFLISCGRSDNTKNGVKEVLNFYGGACTSGVGYLASTSEGKIKYFELEVSESETIENFASEPEMPASNIAYLFYHNLKDEQDDYDEIHTAIMFKDKSRKTFSYTKETLAIVENKMRVAEKMVSLLKNKNFEGIKPFLKPDTTYMHYDKDELIATLAKADPQFGTIKEFVPYGFYFSSTEKPSRKFLHISGALLRDKQSNEFSIDFDLQATNDEMILLQYKL